MQVADQGDVELDDRRTKLGDVPQTGEARSRVVNRDTGMREVPPQLPSRGVVVVDRQPLRDLDDQLPSVMAGEGRELAEGRQRGRSDVDAQPASLRQGG